MTTLGVPIPVETWTHTDSQGHEHRFDRLDGYPTLEPVIDASWWVDGHEEVVVGHFECRLCREVVVPAVTYG